MFQCFVIAFLKWMKYKNRLTFAYYSTKFWDFKSLQSVSKTWKVLKTNFFFKDVQISKYRFLWLPIPISCYFFHKLPASSSVQNTVSRQYFSQNLKISYWKSSFSVHRQILRPPPPIRALRHCLLQKLLDQTIFFSDMTNFLIQLR